jgi:hypothetical protein
MKLYLKHTITFLSNMADGTGRNSCNHNSSDVLIVFFAIAGFLIHLLLPIFAAIVIIIIAVAGGVWLYTKVRS